MKPFTYVQGTRNLQWKNRKEIGLTKAYIAEHSVACEPQNIKKKTQNFKNNTKGRLPESMKAKIKM